MRDQNYIIRVLTVIGCGACFYSSGVAYAQSPEATYFDIPQEDLGRALTDVGRQSRREIMFSADLTRGMSAAGVKGDLSVGQALDELLRGTGLSYQIAASGAITIAGAPKLPESGAEPASFENKIDGTPGLMWDTIVVTGTSEKLRKFETPYAISTLGQENIREGAPHGLVDLVRNLPGITAENSGGEGGGENVVVRGLPWAGFRLLDVQEDGLPLFESNFERELNIDEVYRVDLNTTQVELVRGGTAPIFSNNGSGGVLNLITNHGTATPQGEIEVTGGSHSLARLDAAMSGPITDHLLFSVGGFYRADNGQRDPGFSGADNGGQIKVGATYLLDGDNKLTADVKYLNDHGIFYTDFPLNSPIDGSSLKSLINPNYGTLDSASFKHVDSLALDGAGGVEHLRRDLADGIHPDVTTLTLGGDFTLGGGWTASDKLRYVNGTVLFNGLLNGSAANASTLLAGYLPAAKKAFAGTAALQYVYAGTNQPFNPASTAGLAMTNTWETTTSDYRDLINSLKVRKTLDQGAYGVQDLTFGVDVSSFSLRQAQINATIVTDVKNQPDLLDIQALNGAGQVVGQVTDRGFASFGGGDLIGNVSGTSTAVYGLDDWHITPEWQIDAGVRHQMQKADGNRGLIGTAAVATTGPLADRSITGLTGYQHYSKFLDGTSWTAGSSYLYDQWADFFVRYSSSYSLPRLSDQWGNLNNGVYGTLPDGRPVPTTAIRQAEGGVKVSLQDLQLSAIGFWSHFQDLNASTYVTNPAGQLVNQSLLIDTHTAGVEFEGAWRPVSWFELTGAATFQDPRVDSASTFNSAISASSLVGKEITRTPPYTVSVQPTYLFDAGDFSGRVYLSFFAESRRYQDFTNASVLSPYQTVDFGAVVNAPDGWGADLHVFNLGNSSGLTEGNARAPLSNTLTVADATAGRPIFGRSFMLSLFKRW